MAGLVPVRHVSLCPAGDCFFFRFFPGPALTRRPGMTGICATVVSITFLSRRRVTLGWRAAISSVYDGGHSRTRTMKHRTALLVAATLAFAPFAVQAEPAVVIPPPVAEAPPQGTGLE